MWQVCGWRPWDMHKVRITEYVTVCEAIREMRAG